MIAKPRQKAVFYIMALAIGIATGLAVEGTLAAAEVAAPMTG
jgi:hypothetical protein